MKNFELNIGRACNSRCIFCVSRLAGPEEKVWLSLERAKEEIRRAYQQGCRSLGFLGGEPTIYPHLEEVVRFGRELGYERVALATNGMLLARRSVVERLVGAGVTRFGVSIHSDTARIEDSLTQVQRAFDRKVEGLKHLIELREAGRIPDNVSINPLLHRKILRRMEKMLRFFKNMGIDDIRFNTLRPVTGGKEDRALCPRFTEAMPQVVEAIKINETDLHLHLTFGDLPYCVWPWPFLANPYLVERYVGEHHDLQTNVSIFKDHRDGQAEPERFSWTDEKRDQLKAKLPESCASCAWDKRCEGFWKSYLALHGTGEVVPPQGVYPGTGRMASDP